MTACRRRPLAMALRDGWAGIGVAPLTIHAPYIINLASPEDGLYALSRQAIRRGRLMAGVYRE